MKFSTLRKDSRHVASSGSGIYLRRFKDGETRVRFLDEMDVWHEYYEHRNLEGHSFPCTTDRDTCPGCTHPDEKVSRAGRRYATNVLWVDLGQVLPCVIPVTLANKLENRAERNEGSVTNRDYVVIRKGSGLDTEYDADSDEKYKVDLDKYRAQGADIEAVLEAMYEDVWGTEPQDKPKPRAKETKEEPRRAIRETSKREEEQDDLPPSKPQAQSESAGSEGDDVEITEDELKAMSLFQLMSLATKAGIDFPDESSKPELLNLILAEAD